MATKRPSKIRIDWEALVQAAQAVMKNAYAPYSKFQVGAAVLTSRGNIYSGCNVENSSYGLTVCAERNAVGQAVASGDQEIIAVAIAVPDAPCPPCGMCRQVLTEFAVKETPVALVGKKRRSLHQLGDLLPHAFDKNFL